MALLVGQWLMLAHASEHLAPGQDISCEICLHAERFDSAPVVASARPPLQARVCERPGTPPGRAAPDLQRASCAIRGPPEQSFPDKE